MKLIKLIICALVLFCIVTCFAACSQNEDYINDVFSQLVINESDGETETEELPFTEHIYVIIPRDCSGELSVKARELADEIRNKTGILTSLKYDNELTAVPKNACEVLLGNTNRLVSKNAMDVLREGEYLCRWDDGAIVICGRSEEATVIAVDRFIMEILPSASKYSIMTSDSHFELDVGYEVERVLLNGYDLYDYVLVYPKENKLGEREMAYIFRDFINSKSGYLLEVFSDGDPLSKVGRSIVLTYGEITAIVPNERGISIVGTDSYSLSLAIEKIIGDIENCDGEKKIELNYNAQIDVEYVDSSFESAFYFLKENKQTPFAPVSDLIDLLYNEVGICFIANPNDDMRQDFSLNVKEPLKTYDVILGEREIMIAYNEEKMKQIDISVDTDGSCVNVKVKTLIDEELSFVYAVEGEIPNTVGNAVIFCEDFTQMENDSLLCVAEGTFELSDRNVSYSLALKENLLIKDPYDVVIDDENKACCFVRTEIRYSNTFLNNALK